MSRTIWNPEIADVRQVVLTHSGRGPGTATIIQRFLEEKLLVVLSNVQSGGSRGR